MGPGRYISGCDRRITHANAYSYSYRHSHSHSYSYCHCDSDAHSDSNRNRYIDAKHESYAYSYSYWHSHTETYCYSKRSSVRSASPHTAAETVAIFTRRSFSRSATADKNRSHRFGTGARAGCRIALI
jgi:hypothetical protein